MGVVDVDVTAVVGCVVVVGRGGDGVEMVRVFRKVMATCGGHVVVTLVTVLAPGSLVGGVKFGAFFFRF